MKKLLYTLASMMFATLCFVSCGETEDENTVNGFEYVDLGLPSGTKWASRNVGANKPESAGNYFAWGEVTESNYTELECDAYNLYPSELSKYGITLNSKLAPDYDAATHNMGTGWSTPTTTQFEELMANCTWIWQDSPKGYKVVGSNGNSIFLPVTGYMTEEGSLNYPNEGYYWTSQVEANSLQQALGFGINSSDYKVRSFYRDRGRCVRAVTK